MFVLTVEPETGRVVVGPEESLYQDRLRASRVNYTARTGRLTARWRSA